MIPRNLKLCQQAQGEGGKASWIILFKQNLIFCHWGGGRADAMESTDLLSKHCISLRCFSPVESQHGLPTHMPLFFFLFPKELASALKSALSGHLETVILGLMKTPAQYDASELKASMKVNTVSIRSASNIGELQSFECN